MPHDETSKPTEPDPDGPLFDDEGDIDEDRQDPPTPKKADGEDPELDETAATPGDEPS